MSKPEPFKINVSDELLSFINQRVSTARIPPGLDLPKDDAWLYGIPPATVSELRDYWVQKYDWRAVEARINAHLKMFTLTINEAGEDLKMHFVHHRSEREGAIPLLFQHGWPGNFLEVESIIDSLTDPALGVQAYHVVAPSLPGFVFSEGSKRPDFALKNMAAINHKIMLALGYQTYVAQGGDWGSMTVRIMGKEHPESCVAVHVNMITSAPPRFWRYPLQHIAVIAWAIWKGKSKDNMLGRLLWWLKGQNGYLEIQGTKPQTISYALVDSPIGMLAWIRDKMQPHFGNEYVWQDEDVITWAMLYIIPGTAGHANIYTNTQGKKKRALGELLNKLPKSVDFGASVFPQDISNVPRWWASCTVASNITFWREHVSGGHFAAVEKPDLLVEDIREFTKSLKSEKRAQLVKSGKLKI